MAVTISGIKCNHVDGCNRKATYVVGHPRFNADCHLCDKHADEFYSRLIRMGYEAAVKRRIYSA